MSIRPRDRFLTFKSDNFTCQYCGRKPPEVILECDHVIARANGGGDAMDNLITACRECNIGKGTQDVINHTEKSPILSAVLRRIWKGKWPVTRRCDNCGIVASKDEIEGWDSDTYCLDCAEKLWAAGMRP